MAMTIRPARARSGFLALLAGLAALILAAGAAPARAQGQPVIAFGVGAFDAFESDYRAGQFELQYRGPRLVWWVQPMGGLAVTTDGAVYGYLGISVDIPLGSRLVLRPSFAPGLYSRGDGKDLGHTVEFRSGVELSYRFDNNMRLGLEFYHRSNAGLDDNNKGENSVMLTFAVPTSLMFGK